MGLSIALNNALTGLNVNQQQLAILSQNIANANTAGYSKQVARQDAIYINGEGQGVQITEVTRRIDEFLAKAVQGQNSNVAMANTLNDFNTRIQLLMGTPGGNNSLDAYLNTFFNATQSLSQTPQNTTLQQTAVNTGVTLANQINSVATELQKLQFQADQDIAGAVKKVNDALKRMAELNTQITSNSSLGRSVAELEDERDDIIKEISQYINVTSFKQSNGLISLSTGGGITILDNSVYEISYTPAATPNTFSSETPLSAMTIYRLDAKGNPASSPVTLLTSALPGDATSVFTTGSIAGLLEMREKDIPDILDQLDTLASQMRDEFNAIHNAGSGYPGANSLTGTRLLFAQQVNQWDGQARIAVLDSNGQPLASPYPDEPNGVTPLVLDLEKMDTGSGVGIPSVQGIINAINQYYGTPQNKAKLGNLNNIQLVSDSTTLPGVPAQFSFDFNLNNLSTGNANFYVTNVQVKDNNAVDITSVTSTIPVENLDVGSTYVTSAGSNQVTVNTATTHSLNNGQVVYLSAPPGGPYDGIPASALGGYFTISNVTATSFQITLASASASAGATIGVAGQTATPPYAAAPAGGDTRTRSNGLFTADLTANTSAPFYTVTASVAVDDGTGVIKTSNVTYRIENQQPNMLNRIFGGQTATGSGSIVAPTSIAPLARAMLVDENGNELPKINGVYTNTQGGYLKIMAGASSSSIAIDSLNSMELGNPTVSPAIAGSQRGFSHYFNLNDFFQSHDPVNTGETVKNSALNMRVEERMLSNPGLLALGQLSKSPNSINPLDPLNYTYQLNPGDNSIITRLALLSNANFNFAASGGLGTTVQTFRGYTGQIIGTAASNASTASNNRKNADALLQGYEQNASAISGVNLDTELANTIIYQNAYSASARVITVANQLFDTLLESF
jgi:flagellar hook-associated protein 1